MRAGILGMDMDLIVKDAYLLKSRFTLTHPSASSIYAASLDRLMAEDDQLLHAALQSRITRPIGYGSKSLPAIEDVRLQKC